MTRPLLAALAALFAGCAEGVTTTSASSSSAGVTTGAGGATSSSTSAASSSTGAACVEGDVCDDLDACTHGDVCVAGVCTGALATCPPGLACVRGGCVTPAACTAHVGLPGPPEVDAPGAVAALGVDVNGDAKADLVVLRSGAGSAGWVDVRFGNINGFYGAAATFPAGASPSAIASADVDNDGKRDVVVASSASGTISVLENDGQGGLLPAVGVGVAQAGVVDVALPDMNDDGRPDVVALTSTGVSVALALQGGGFGAPVTVAVGATARDVVVADVDADGDTDVLVGSDGGVRVLQNDGAGGLGTPAVFAGVNKYVTLDAADIVGGDGLPDVVASIGAVVHVLQNSGGGNLSLVALGSGASTDLRLAHVGGSPAADLVLANPCGVLGCGVGLNARVAIALQSGTAFEPQTFYDAPTAGARGPRVLAVDLTLDGKRDLVVVGASSVLPLVNTGKSTAELVAPRALGQFAAASVAVGDVDGDGHVDVVRSVVGNASHRVDVHLGVGDGTFGATPVTSPTVVASNGAPTHATLADVNGDGAVDLLMAGDGSPLLVFLPNAGGGAFGAAQLLPASASATGRITSIATADFDGNLSVDVAAGVDAPGASTVAIFLGPTRVDVPFAGRPTGVAARDADGDGDVDVFVADGDGDTVTLLSNDGLGAFTPSGSFPAGTAPSAIAARDVDGDGDTDVVVAGAVCAVLLRDAQGGYGATTFACGSDAAALSLADVDTDGLPDISVLARGDNTLRWSRNAGGGVFDAPSVFRVRSLPTDLASGDLDGDGRPDFVTAGADVSDVMLMRCTP